MLKSVDCPYGISVSVDDANRLYASSRTFMGYSDDEGYTWSTIQKPKSNNPVVDFSLRASNSDLLIAYNDVFDTDVISTDLGRTWEQVPPDGNVIFSNLGIWWGDTLIKYSIYHPGYFLSGDLGKTWKQFLVDSNQNVTSIGRIDDTDVFAILNFGNSYYLSHDNGNHYAPITSPATGIEWLVPGPGPGTYLAGEGYANGAVNEDTVLITHDNGQHWLPIRPLLGHGSFYDGLYTKEGAILIGGDTNYVSYDSAKTWYPSNTIFSSSDKLLVHGSELWTSYNNTLQVTTDLGESWRNISTPVAPGQFFFTSSGAIIFNGWYADQFASTDGGSTWQDILPVWTDDPWAGQSVIGDTILVVRDTTLFISTSLGNQWDTLIFPDSLYHHATEHLLVTPKGSLWIFVKNDSMCISNDLGGTYGPLIASNLAQEYWFDSSGNVYAYQSSCLCRSSDNGISWDTIHLPAWGPTDGSLMDVWGYSNNLFVSYSDSGIYHTTNAGVSWNSANTGIADRIAGYLASLDGNLFLTSDGGVFRDADTASPNGNFLLAYPVSIARPGPIIWISVAPNKTELSSLAAFPNPAINSTTLRFNAPESGYATITVMNALGAVVSRVYSGGLSVGEHSVTWNVPSGLAPGMYECVVRMNGSTQHVPILIQ